MLDLAVHVGGGGWARLGDLLQQREGTVLVNLEGRVLAVGGRRGTSSTGYTDMDTVEELDMK